MNVIRWLKPGEWLCVKPLPSLVSLPTHSTVIVASDMASLNQIDTDVKQGDAAILGSFVSVNTRLDTLAAFVRDGFATINKRLDEIEGDSPDDTQQVVDATNQLADQTQKLADAIASAEPKE